MRLATFNNSRQLGVVPELFRKLWVRMFPFTEQGAAGNLVQKKIAAGAPHDRRHLPQRTRSGAS
jgi:hypothetical protein